MQLKTQIGIAASVAALAIGGGWFHEKGQQLPKEQAKTKALILEANETAINAQARALYYSGGERAISEASGSLKFKTCLQKRFPQRRFDPPAWKLAADCAKETGWIPYSLKYSDS